MWNKAVLDGSTGQWFPIPVWFRLLLDRGRANVSSVVPSPVWLSEQPKFHTEREVGSAVTDVTRDVQVEFNRVLNSEQCSEHLFIHRTCSALAFPSRCKPADCKLALIVILLWPLELATVRKLLLEGLLRAGGGRLQIPSPCTATWNILSLGVTVLGRISRDSVEMSSQSGWY